MLRGGEREGPIENIKSRTDKLQKSRWMMDRAKQNKQNILAVLQVVGGVEYNVRFETNRERESTHGRDAGARLAAGLE